MARYDVVITPLNLDAEGGATYIIKAFPVSEKIEVFSCCKPLHLNAGALLEYFGVSDDRFAEIIHRLITGRSVRVPNVELTDAMAEEFAD